MSSSSKFDEAVHSILRAAHSNGPHQRYLLKQSWDRLFDVPTANSPRTVTGLDSKSVQNLQGFIPKLDNIEEWDAYLKTEHENLFGDTSSVSENAQAAASSNHHHFEIPPASFVEKTRQPNASVNSLPVQARPAAIGGGLNVNAVKATSLGGVRGPASYYDDDENVSHRPHLERGHATWPSSSSSSSMPHGQNHSLQPPSSSRQVNHEPPSFVSAKSRYAQQSPNDDGQFDTRGGIQGGSGSKPFKPPTRLGEPPPVRNHPGARPAVGHHRPGAGGGNFTRQPVQNAARAMANANNLASANEEDVHPRLRGIDPDLIERIENEILESGQPVTFDDIAGLSFAKQCIEEMVVWPVRNPEFYTGLRQLPKGLLLFGPPGTGKTVLGKAIAHECKATFFSISASSLTSKWIGEGEKMVRALFAVAAVRQPSVVFIDEIDSLLTQRSSDENEASRRIKTEFLVQFDGAATGADDVVLIIGATNRPQELDEAARRRFVRRLYVPLPNIETRCQLLAHLLKKNENCLTAEEIEELGRLTEGYSGADVTNLAREASMGPLREVLRGGDRQQSKELRPISRRDFDVALKSVKASVSNMDLALYEKWNNEFGTQQFVEE